MSDEGRRAPGTPDEHDGIQDAVGWMLAGRCVLFDFDGPLCRLFPDRSSAPVARELRDILDGEGAGSLLDDDERESIDPHVVLRAVDRERRGSPLVARLEERIAERETEAAATAWPTPAADLLVHGLSEAGVRLAVTTNNAPVAVDVYLRRAGLARFFGSHVYGRTGDPRLMKPDPHCLYRALDGLRAPADDAVLIGDTVTDLLAAREAGVRFVGYARNERKAAPLRKAGAGLVVHRLEPLVDAVTSHSS
ncbi:HAD family hydrolase [Streptomyces sp. NPDC001848]|uniref:HAD family hydrolase n=1 Tax=Streptomyces sp. NPDC001848 TaxID=3364618 RepID=UPI0036BFC930